MEIISIPIKLYLTLMKTMCNSNNWASKELCNSTKIIDALDLSEL